MALTHTEWSTMDLPVSLYASGTPKRRKIVIFRGTSTSTGDTLDVSGTACPDAADIEGLVWCTINGAGLGAGSAYPTWSTNTLTLATATGAWELGILVNLT
jgi:hypothetical protein